MRVVVVLLVTGENKVNSFSDQLKLGQVCKFGVEFDKILLNSQEQAGAELCQAQGKLWLARY